MKTRICLGGATGNVGRNLVTAILAAEDLELSAAVGKKSAGGKLGQLLNLNGLEMTVSASVTTALKTDTDVYIDYTKPDSVKENVHHAISNGVHVVIGTSGLSDEEYSVIDQQAKANSVGVLAAGNFSLTATLMQHFALIAAKFLPTWEIFDYAPDTKPDAPSGTALELAYQLSKTGYSQWTVPVEKTQGIRESRGASLNGSQVHSVRVPGFYSSSEVIFGQPGERLALRHDSISYQPYVDGTLLAARRVGSFTGLKRGLAEILEL